MKKLLILTLYSGECDYPMLVASLKQQSFRDWDHEIIENLPNKEAHEHLYRTIAAHSSEYRWFLKLDADMVFRDQDCLKEMIEIAESNPDSDQLVWPVADYLSARNIYGVHLFSGRVRWKFPLPDLFVDADPSMPGRKIQFPRKSDAFLLHSAFPSVEQAFRFGVHRGLKCFSAAAKVGQKYSQLDLLQAVWAQFSQHPDPWRAALLVGAEMARLGMVPSSDYKAVGLATHPVAEAMVRDVHRARLFCRWYWAVRAPMAGVWLKILVRLGAK